VTLASIWEWFFPTTVWLLALGWLWQLSQWLRHSDEIADLTEIPPDQLPALPTMGDGRPHLTVVVPACNEEAAIAITLSSLLRSKDLRLQIIAVDDRSTDRTGAIMDDMALSDLNKNLDHSLQVIHVKTLEPEWLGKPHALAKAAELAEAEWILFTDGDVIFAPQALSLAMRYALVERADHLVVMPDWLMQSHGEAAMHGAMHALSTWTLHLWRIANPEALDFLGVGAFNLVRHSAYEALGGFEALRMEVLEDLRFGWMVKRAGYRQRVALGPGLAAVRWSHGAWGVVRNLEKNLFALYRYRVGFAVLACMGLLVQIVWPLAALVAGGWARTAAIVLYGTIAAIYVSSRKVTRVRPFYVLVYPLAASLFLVAMVRSTFLTLARGGVIWRGTLYPLKELRAHAGRFWR
jgi:glycosyltransferase involved in cell wall biosynthesis